MTPSGEGSETSIQECCQLGNIFRDPWMGALQTEVRGGRVHLWTLARQAAKRLGVRIDVSGDENLRIVADDVSVSPVKAVRGLRKVARQRYTRDLISDKSHQGVVATGLSLEDKSKDMARLEQDTSCRRCGKENETGFHVLNHCEEGLQLATKRHNTIQDLLESLLVKQGHDVTINNAIPGQRLRPDVEFQLSGSRVMVDVVVCYDQPGSMENAYQRKYDKYSSHGRILPLVVGSLGSWYPRNDEIRSILGINGRSWGAFRFKARLAAIQGSMDMVCAHFHHHGAPNPEAEDIPLPRRNSLPTVGCRNPGSNQGPLDLQSNALPTELFRHITLTLRPCGIQQNDKVFVTPDSNNHHFGLV
ncbi:hypothetical protein OUZ56_025650 [Daphnia magna]|uniref:Reverse transcriptase n=1 Tax=Daphnia magna TaxID=35525 RepID=A0ABQ9ZL95_9CRUS|nr:hypothetical protein OUZ56_025650 [Daphnia magna]